MPDILIECRWELEWLLKMQRFDGAVWHKATTAKHAAFVMPEDDREQMYVLPVSSSATADFAAVTALASGIYREFDKAFSGRLLKSSCAAYEWLEKYPGFIGFRQPRGLRDRRLRRAQRPRQPLRGGPRSCSRFSTTKCTTPDC